MSLKTLAINGSDLIKDGHTPGKNLGIILDTLLNEVIEEKLPNEKNALLTRANELKKEQGSEPVVEETIKIKEKMPPKRKAVVVIIAIIALFAILIPITLFANSCYEKKVQDIFYKDAVLYSSQMLAQRYNYKGQYLFERDPVAVYYASDDVKFYETKEIVSMSIRAFDQEGNSYICTVYFYGENVKDWNFDNYKE